MAPRVFGDAGAQSTCASPITNAQTTITLASASGFPAIPGGSILDCVIFDSGNPSYNVLNPFATPYEYQPLTLISGSTVTINGGTRGNYAGTTPHAYFTGATVAAVLLAESLGGTTPAVWRADGGGIGAYHAEVYFGGSESVSSGSAQIVQNDTILHDPNGNYNTSNWIYSAPLPGRYLVTAAINWSMSSSPACTLITTVYKNGVEVNRLQQLTVPANANSPQIGGACIVRVPAANDGLAIYCYQASGGGLALVSGANLTYASYTYLGVL